MAARVDPLLRHIHRLVPLPEAVADGELLARFVQQHDPSAFAELVRRHGPMVLGVCRRVLDGAAETEDTFQAVFFLLARKAASLRRPDGLAAWLHGVARHLALRCRRARKRRRHYEAATTALASPKDPLEELTARELLTVLDQEIQRLPDVYRLPLILCGLEGLTYAQAARRLGWSRGSVKGRLLRGRQRLQERLARKGLMLPMGFLVLTAVVASISPALATSTVEAVMRCATGDMGTGLPALIRGAFQSLRVVKLPIGLGVLLASLIAAGAGVWALQTSPPKQTSREPPETAEKARAEGAKELRQDRHGDPLPSGAVMRLGTVRFRAGGLVHACALSPDGKVVAVASANRTVCLFDAATGDPIRRLQGHANNVTSLAYSPDGKTLASSDASNFLCIWEVSTGKLLRQFPVVRASGPIWAVVFSHDGTSVLSGGAEVGLWDAATGKELRRFRGNPITVRCLALSPDGQTFATGTQTELRLWDLKTGKMLVQLGGDKKRLRALAFSPNGKLLAAGHEEGTIELWDVATRKLRPALADGKPKQVNSVHALAFSPDGKTLAAGRSDYALGFWDVETGKLLRQRVGTGSTTYTSWHDGGIQSLTYTADGRRLLAGQDNRLVVMDAQTGEEVQPREGHRGGVRRVFFDRDGRRLIATSDDPSRRLLEWDTATSKMLRQVPGECMWAQLAAFSPDRKILASTGIGAGIHLWDTTTGKEIRPLALPIPNPSSSPGAIVFSPDGKRLAVAGPEWKELWLFDIATGKLLWGMQGARNGVHIHLLFSSDGRTLATVGYASMHLIDIVSGRVLRRMAFAKDRQTHASAISPDGRTLAVVSGDWMQKTVALWEIASGKERLSIPAPPSQLNTVTFSPDGRLLAAAGWDRSVYLWDAGTGKQRRRLEGHHGDIDSLAFAPDGRRLASASHDTTVLIWDVPQLPSEKPRATPLTQKELDTAWSALASADAARAYQSMRTLQSVPDQAVTLFAERLRPRPLPDATRLTQLLKQLESDDFTQRERATEELRKLGWSAEPALRKALAEKPSLEARKRMQDLLDGIGNQGLPLELVRLLRGVEVLEQVNTTAARQLLQKLADSALGEGLGQEELSREARSSLERLSH